MPRELFLLIGAAAVLLVCLSSCAVSGDRPVASSRLSRDTAYWRGRCEVSPGPFLCEKPAATNVTVTCDRWPDTTDLRQFGLDAARLSGAKTDSEKCQAVWRWVRRCTMCTNGNAPAEPFENPHQGYGAGGYISDPIKVLNVYGAHWCDGLSQAVACVWRAMGYRAEKFYAHGHTLVDCFYRDADGQERWHLFDASDGGFVLDRTGSRVISPDESVYDFFHDWFFGYVHCQHLEMPTHRMDLAFRSGEKLERTWGNWGQAYQNNVGKLAQWVPASPTKGNGPDEPANRERAEHGPYPYTFGNGRWIYAPDLSKPDWATGLAAEPTGLADGKLMPAAAGKVATAVWRFRTPYIVSDAQVKLKLFRKTAADTVRLNFSVDDGKTFKPLWECPPEAVGEQDLCPTICAKFDVGKNAKPPEGFNSPFGRYQYLLKLELFAKDAPADCRVEGIEFVTTVQENHYALPQLHQGRNHITVKGDLAAGAALKVTYLWDDTEEGKDRRNVTIVERTPHTYEIISLGGKWEDCVCKSITIEEVPASGKGNRTEVKEAEGVYANGGKPPLLSIFWPAADTRTTWLFKPDRATLPSVEQLIADLATPAKTQAALYGLIELREPKAFEAIKKLVYEVEPPADWKNPLTGVKELSLAALYQVDRDKARPVLLDVLSEPAHSKWKPDPKGFNGTWIGGAAVIGYIAADAGWKEFVPHLVKALQTPGCHEEAARGLLRSLGRLGDPQAGGAIRKFLGDGMDVDTAAVAALAAGQVGDREAIPQLRKLLRNGYSPAALNAAQALGMLADKQSASVLRAWLTRQDDENFRGIGAEALGNLGDADSIKPLEEALQAEPFPWVRGKITAALGKLRR